MEIKQELRPYVPLAQMLVQTLGPDCEVVLHDLDTPAHSVVYVENPSVTGRKVGESFVQLVKQVICQTISKRISSRTIILPRRTASIPLVVASDQERAPET